MHCVACAICCSDLTTLPFICTKVQTCLAQYVTCAFVKMQTLLARLVLSK